MANLIQVIGVGPGHPDYITPEASRLINEADILVGGERLLELYKDTGKELYPVKNNLQEMAGYIRERYRHRSIAVLASGDPAFYGILEHLKRNFAASELKVSPGISSAQLACARLGISWHDAAFHSVHGRGADGLADLVRVHPKVIVLTDPSRTPAVIAGMLAAEGIKGKKIYVCENLSYADEHIGEFTIENVPGDVGTSGCVVVICDE
ncbi:precorrin-6y C5,15-methyltransferase (decarboxylating) subunit CbiE [Phosphitispora fastidiosa]|uniref:precorrin-6y C5,15-methyltransferase (decarboxylating) subunit CbiE n=1 Tax=Phosphitispora fastidiosa TaxID=2837202 RepID=UPI001E2ED191|nr:cobalt-precorrin-7 (C5)-methyltransferase [Phosphitispora fastidiosa]